MDILRNSRPLLVINGKSYKELSILGKGGFAKVYKAVNIDTLQEVAIKKIFREKINNKSMIKKVNEEIMNHRSLKHPSILAIYDFYEDSRYIYLVLELCSKGDLVGYLQRHQRKRVSEAEACTIAKTVLDGLQHLHSHGILHRDLKLANILVTENNRIKIADFGLSTKLKGVADTHRTMCGTPNFMSPEVAAQAPHGLGVDMWGLGAVLYTLICGEPPFKTYSITSTLEKVRSETLKIPDFVSDEARDVLRLLMEKNPNCRITAERAREHQFFRKYPDSPLRCNTNDSGLGVSCVACADCNRFHAGTRESPCSIPRNKFISTKRLGRICLKAEKGLCYIKSKGEVVLELSLKGSLQKLYYVVTNDSYMTSFIAPEYVWPPPDSSVRHHCSSLPAKWHKKYALLDKVVYKVKSKTVKITLHSDVATCQLMESSPDHFFVDFCSGEKLRKSQDTIMLDQPQQRPCYFSFYQLQTKCTDTRIVNIFLQLYEKCLKLEKELDEDLFPISCGRRVL